MATTIAVVGQSGEGKSTGIRTLDPTTSFIINADGKSLPFKDAKIIYNREKKNYIETSDIDTINKLLTAINEKQPHIKTVVLDTANAIMIDREMSVNFRNRKSGGDAMNKWIEVCPVHI